jgi:MoxR-like ATPase
MHEPEPSDVQSAERLKQAYDTIRGELAKVIVGQDAVINQLFVALVARGHCILTGVPGLAKTLMIQSLSRTLRLKFNRVQFTPDLMPTDITGTEIIQENRSTGQREMVFIEGPVFTNVMLADEINRTPPRTQAALLEAMQERQVTTAGVKRVLPERAISRADTILSPQEIVKFGEFREMAINNNRMALAVNRKLMAPATGK